jgi:hypothetical protein
MRPYTFLLLAAMMLAASCGIAVSEQKLGAAKKAADMVEAASFVLSYRKSADSDAGRRHTLTLSLKNVKALRDSHPKDLLASLVALKFINELNEAEYKDVDKLVISFEEEKESWEKSYSIAEVLEAKELMETVFLYFEHTQAREYEKIAELVDTAVVPAEAVPELSNLLASADSAFGPLTSYSCNGFRFERDEDVDRPGVRFWGESYNGTVRTDYTFYVVGENKKIGNIDLSVYNEAEAQ